MSDFKVGDIVRVRHNLRDIDAELTSFDDIVKNTASYDELSSFLK